MSDFEIPTYPDPHPDPAAERINAECQARIEAQHNGIAQLHAEWAAEDCSTVPDWTPADTGAITVQHKTLHGVGIIGRLIRRTVTGKMTEVVK